MRKYGHKSTWDQLGCGTYGAVSKSRDRAGKVVAIKEHFHKELPEVQRAYEREYCLLSTLTHDNIIQLLEVFLHRGTLYGVFELLDHSVFDELEGTDGGLDEVPLRGYIYQILRAVGFLHHHDILHRDLKPDNFLVSRSGVVKLADFGAARRLALFYELHTPTGCAVGFGGPEILLQDIYGPPSDVWAIGCSIIMMATGRSFVEGVTEKEELMDIISKIGLLTQQQEEMYFSLYGDSAVLSTLTKEHKSLTEKYGIYDVDLVDLVDRCLRMDPADRPSCSELLQHRYFTRDHFPDTFLPELQEKIRNDRCRTEELDSPMQTLDEQREGVGKVSDTSLQNGSAPSVEKSSKEKIKKKGIKAAFHRAFKASKRVFTQPSSPEDKPVLTANKDPILTDGSILDHTTSQEVWAETPQTFQEDGGVETEIKTDRQWIGTKNKRKMRKSSQTSTDAKKKTMENRRIASVLSCDPAHDYSPANILYVCPVDSGP